MSFFGDLEQWGSDLVTGRWLGGETNLAHDNWTPAAAIGGTLLTGGLAAGALGGGAALGAAEGAAAGSEFVGPTLAQAGLTDAAAGGGVALDPWAAASPEALGGFASASPAETAAAGGGAGGGTIADALAPYGANPDMVSGALAAPDAVGGAGPMAPGGAADGGGSFFSRLGTGAMDSITKNPLGIGASALGLGLGLAKGQKTTANEQNVGNITSAAAQQAQYDTVAGRQLQSYLEGGTLPKGMQAQVDKARKAARAAAISNAAKNGQNTNPQQNTQLQQAFEDADRNALILATQMETNLWQQGMAMVNAGLQATQLSMAGFEFLTNQDNKNNAVVTNAMIAMAGAFGGSKGINTGGSRAV